MKLRNSLESTHFSRRLLLGLCGFPILRLLTLKPLKAGPKIDLKPGITVTKVVQVIDEDGVEILARAIAAMEGFYSTADTLAKRFNNPGCLRNGEGGFAIFESPKEGWDALETQLYLYLGEEPTLKELIYKWAPPVENNSDYYVHFVLGYIQAKGSSISSVDIPLSFYPKRAMNPKELPRVAIVETEGFTGSG